MVSATQLTLLAARARLHFHAYFYRRLEPFDLSMFLARFARCHVGVRFRFRIGISRNDPIWHALLAFRHEFRNEIPVATLPRQGNVNKNLYPRAPPMFFESTPTVSPNEVTATSRA